MSAAYDYYDYPSYWRDRKYEHISETLAIKSFLANIPKIRTILDIGAGFGRLTPSYLFRGSKVILADPSARLLKIARQNIKVKKVKFIQSKLENIPKKIHKGSIDLIILVRVLHHLDNIDNSLRDINNLLGSHGYLIIEFANKRHFKAVLNEFLKGNFTFSMNILPKDIRSKKNINKKTLPFVNYHPDDIIEKLKENGFEILEKRSVSNLRSSFLKGVLPFETLGKFEESLQVPLSYINFGPSIFILAKKIG